ncbi:MAG: DNA polymerase ligase N-terminal domain-containing protein [Bdellovibrionota bacterium]
MARGSLTTYDAKRDFKKTREPRGELVRQQSKRRFVVQRHEASHLHWDFRLELEGVLKSWAVPREPSLDPSVKRLAVQVEDHPLAYRTFEGDIPKGEYGAGHVDIWDSGFWIPRDKNPSEAYAKGSLTFELRGKRLKGRWHLIRTRRGERTPQWLLFKGKDGEAREGARKVSVVRRKRSNKE